MSESDIFLLREIEEKDLETVLRWRNSERVSRNMFTDRVITFDEHKNWFIGIRHNPDSKCLVFEYERMPAGVVNFTGIDEVNGRCHWGFYLGETGLPPGTGSVMGFLGLEYAFSHFKICKICSEVFAFNEASINYHKKLGFIEEGRLAAHAMKNGSCEDVILFALFKDHWLAARKHLEGSIFKRNS